MKLLIKITILLFAFTSCCKDDDIDFDEKRNNIVGEWNVTQATREIRADTVYAESSMELTITFNQDGTGIKETILGAVEFEWFYQFNPEQVVINSKQSGIILSNVQFYDITKNEMDRQIWEFEVESLSGIADVYLHTWKMDRK